MLREQHIALQYAVGQNKDVDNENSIIFSPYCVEAMFGIIDKAENEAFDMDTFLGINAALKYVPTRYGHEGIRGGLSVQLVAPYLSTIKDRDDPFHAFARSLPPQCMQYSDNAETRSVQITQQLSVYFPRKYVDRTLPWKDWNGDFYQNITAFTTELEGGYDASAIYARIVRLRVPTCDPNIPADVIFFLPTMHGREGFETMLRQMSEFRWNELRLKPTLIRLTMPNISITAQGADLKTAFQADGFGDVVNAICKRGVLNGGDVYTTTIAEFFGCEQPDVPPPTRTEAQSLKAKTAREITINSPFACAFYMRQKLISFNVIKNISFYSSFVHFSIFME